MLVFQTFQPIKEPTARRAIYRHAATLTSVGSPKFSAHQLFAYRLRVSSYVNMVFFSLNLGHNGRKSHQLYRQEQKVSNIIADCVCLKGGLILRVTLMIFLLCKTETF